MRFAVATLVFTLLTATAAGVGLAAQDTAQTPDTQEGMRQGMMAMRRQMAADQQAARARLQGLLDQLASAEGDTRIEAMSALVTELAEQQLHHLQHMEQMMGMMEQMMGGGMMGMMHRTPPETQSQR